MISALFSRIPPPLFNQIIAHGFPVLIVDMEPSSNTEKTALFRGLNGTLGYIEFQFLELNWKSFDEQKRNRDESIIGCSFQIDAFSNYYYSFEKDYFVGDTLDEVIETKGWLGCNVRFRFAVSSTKNSRKPLFLFSDPFVILEKRSSVFELPLYSDSFLIGDAVLVVGYKFFPNQMSFPYLVIRCFHEYVYTDGSNHAAVKLNRFSSKFLVEMQSLLRGQLELQHEEDEEKETFHSNNNSPNRSSRNIISVNDSRKLLGAVDYLFRLLAHDRREITQLLEGKHPDGLASQTSADEASNTEFIPNTKKEYNVYYVAHVTKSLLGYLHEEYCDKAPAVDMILVDKLQSIFFQSVHTNISYVALLYTDHDRTTQGRQLSGNKSSSFDFANNSVWNTQTAIAFLVASAFWYVEQQLCNQNIFHQFFHSTVNTITIPNSIKHDQNFEHNHATDTATTTPTKEAEEVLFSLQEFASLVKRFQFYDTFATQMIAWSDLPLLLQDLGGADYSREEILYIIKQLDKERSGLIEFGDFIQWWCANEEESEVEISYTVEDTEETDENEEEEEEEEAQVVRKGRSGMLKGIGENGELFCMSIGEGKSLEDIVMDSVLFSSGSVMDDCNHQSQIDYLLNENDLEDDVDDVDDKIGTDYRR